ncbi:MAG TPA: DUF2911 domain-containing protein [Cyclobacteriaceae bacterium]|nr:DUF2911 domain-containing protein [Cyclobacteriaceae bacterium]
MKKKIFLGLGILFTLFIIWAVYGLFFAPKKSPAATASYNDKGLDIKVSYSQPSKRGRVIFGEESAGALQPYGKYWRLGANAATEITFNKNITFAGQAVDAGTYRMYAVPGAQSFKIILNSEVGVNFTAASDADHALDILTADIPASPTASEVETFTISFEPDSAGVNMNMAWDKILLRVPVGLR